MNWIQVQKCDKNIKTQTLLDMIWYKNVLKGDRKKCCQRPRDRDWPRGLNFPSILDVLHWMDFELAIYYETTYHRWRKPWLGVWGRNSQTQGDLFLPKKNDN